MNYTNQTAFDKVVEHLLTAKGQSRKEGFSTCYYKAVMLDGSTRKCAVGALIPDEIYQPRMDPAPPLGVLLREFPDVKEIFKGVEVNLLQSLQCTHDNLGHWDEDGFNDRGKMGLREIAEAFNLKLPAALTPTQEA